MSEPLSCPARPGLRLVLIGDGESPHLLKWARALAPRVQLFAISSRGFAEGFDEVVPAGHRLALHTRPRFSGGNVGLLWHLPQVVRWLRQVRPDWLAPHYLSSHGVLAWLAVVLGRLPVRMVGSAWGSDILVTPARSRILAWLTRRVLQACALTTSDSAHMAVRMRALGAGEVMTFPFGLESLPPVPAEPKDDALFFANRGLEPIYAPGRVLDSFAGLAGAWPEARLVMANEGSLRGQIQARIDQLGLSSRVTLAGRLGRAEQEAWYARARWYLSLPISDSVSVSVLEAMAHGTIPILSDLPANHELIGDGERGLILRDGEALNTARLAAVLARADALGQELRDWVAQHAFFPEAVQRFVARLEALSPAK